MSVMLIRDTLLIQKTKTFDYDRAIKYERLEAEADPRSKTFKLQMIVPQLF